MRPDPYFWCETNTLSCRRCRWLKETKQTKRILAHIAAIEEHRKNPAAYVKGNLRYMPKGKKRMSYTLPPMGDSENWMQIARRQTRSGSTSS